MPVDKDELKAKIQEASGGDAEFAKLLEEKFTANDAAATAFVGGFMRNRDYTQKNQGLADERKTLEGQVEQYRQLLDAAETEKAAVMKDLAAHKVSVAEAHARLKHVKDTYRLSNDDVPDYQDLIDTSNKRKVVDNSSDLDQRFAAFEKKMGDYIAQKLVPELGGMAQLDIVWSDIRDEHRELTGKRLTAKEQQELLAEADKRSKAGRPISLKALWEEKYDAPELRQKAHDTGLEKELRAKWDAEQAAKISEAALAGVRPQANGHEGLRTSQILDHKFQTHEEAPAGVPKGQPAPSANDRSALSGAERAGKRFLERRAAGIPMGGKEAPAKVA